MKLIRLSLMMVALLFLHHSAPAQVYRWIPKLSMPGLGNPLQYNPLDTNILYAPGMLGGNGTVFISRDRGKHWQPYSTITGGMEVKSLIINPKDTLMMVAAQRGATHDRVMKTTDGGGSWVQTLSGTLSYFGVALEFNPAHPDTVFIMVSDTIRRSVDFGSTWSTVSQQSRFNTWCDAALRPDSVDVMYIGDNTSGIWKTTDGGLTFRLVYATSGEIPMIAIDQRNPAVAYATKWSGGGGFLKTTDYGETWNEIPQFAHLDCWGVSIAASDPSTIVMGTYTLADSWGIYISHDGGTSWSRIVDGLRDRLNYGLLAIDATTILALQADGVYNLESSTTIVTGHVQERGSLAPVMNGTIVKSGSSDSIHLSRSGGAYAFAYFPGDSTLAFTNAYPFYPASTTLQFKTDSTVVQDVVLDRLLTGTITGVVEDSLTHGGIRADLLLKTGTINGMQTITTSSDSAGRFQFDNVYVSFPPIVGDYQMVVDPKIPYSQLYGSSIHVDSGGQFLRYPVLQAEVFVVGEDSASYSDYYRDALKGLGLRMSLWNTIVKGDAPFRRGIEFKKNTVIYFSGTKHTPMRQAELDSLTTCLDAGCNLFLTGQDIVEKNDSSSFFQRSIGIRYGGVSSIPYAKGLAAELFDGFGFYTIGEGAQNQTSQDIITITDSRVKAILGYGGVGNNGIAAVRLDSVGSGGKAIVMGFGFEAINTFETRMDVMSHIFAYFDGTIVLRVEDTPQLGHPTKFTLEQNYPNPFNPSTSLSYGIAQKGHVTLKIFNILGEEVESLVDDDRDPGSYVAHWNAETHPSGIYMSQMTLISSEGKRLFQGSRKLLFVK